MFLLLPVRSVFDVLAVAELAVLVWHEAPGFLRQMSGSLQPWVLLVIHYGHPHHPVGENVTKCIDSILDTGLMVDLIYSLVSRA